jgi:methionyl-tRNA formyltransferase
MPVTGLRVVTFNVFPPAYQLISRWAEQTGNKIVLVVTTPGPSTRRMPMYRGVLNSAPPDQDVLVTTRIRRVALPLIRELQPDLIVSLTFPYRLPPELTSLPRYGALNLHPTALPAYRGPNPMRAIYEGYPTLGATLHRTEEEFDTGIVYAQYTAPMPVPTTRDAVLAVWAPLWMRAFAEGVERAIAGEPGTPQDHSKATYGAQFSEEEHWLNLAEPRAVLQRKETALNLAGGGNAKVMIEGKPYLVQRIEPLADSAPAAEPGTVLERNGDTLTLRVGDGAIQIAVTPATA